jgi:hypothetical protein
VEVVDPTLTISQPLSECYDTWRQNIQPNLIANKPWPTISSKTWTSEQKIDILLQVIQVRITVYDRAAIDILSVYED